MGRRAEKQAKGDLCHAFRHPHVKYRSARVAEFDLGVLRAQGAVNLNMFRCKACHCWHLGNR